MSTASDDEPARAALQALTQGEVLREGPDGLWRSAAPRRRGRPRKGSSAQQPGVGAAVMAALVADGYAVIEAGGARAAPRLAAGRDPDAFRRARQTRAEGESEDGERIEIDLSESPLRWLATRRDAQGNSFLATEEVEAGERFRRDFTLAALAPRMGVAFDAPGSGGGPRGVDYSDVVVAARQRLSNAARALGPDFSSLVTDVCGFVMGLEEAEKARRWPPRSAKVVLKMALAALARHYGLQTEARGPERSRGVRAWRAQG